MEYIDGHAHLPLVPGALENMLAVMDQAGIQRSIAIAGGSISPELLSKQISVGGTLDIDIDNQTLAAACERSHGRLIPFYFANPHRGAESYRTEGRSFAGLKLGPAVHGIGLRDRRHLELLETAEHFGAPVYLHCLARPGFEVTDLVYLAKQFPRVALILGHAGVGNCDFHAVSVIEDQPNIYFETSGGFTSVIIAACRRLGVGRVLFGTEYPLQNPRVEIEKAHCLGLDETELRLVMGANMMRLISGGNHE